MSDTTEAAYTFPPPDLEDLAEECAKILIRRGETISVAETAAGGLISAALLAVNGASRFYKGGLTVYSLESRMAFAGWTPEHIVDYKGPTQEIVAGLAQDVADTLKTTYCLSESGTAGPTGGNTRNRTPGYVALALWTPRGPFTVERETGSADRKENMVRFAIEALTFLRTILNDIEGARVEEPMVLSLDEETLRKIERKKSLDEVVRNIKRESTEPSVGGGEKL